MKYRFLLFFLLAATGLELSAQNTLPVIKASSKQVDVIDGVHIMKKYWVLLPEKKPDYYYVEIPAKQHRVSFITDSDSISFDVEYGKDYDFIILLNNRDSCYTRVSARYRSPDIAARKTLLYKTDTIPFTIGDNSKIYFKAKLNDSAPLDVQFDLGAGGTIIKKSSVEKVTMNFDDTILLHNSDGANQVPASKTNKMEIGNLEWNNMHVAVADNMTYREDLLAGNRLFNTKVLEINYDKKIIVVHDSLPLIDAAYSRHDIILEGSIVPFIQASLLFKSKTKQGWFLFDTGAYTSIFDKEHIPVTNKMMGEARRMIWLSDKSFTPELTIGNYSFSRFAYVTQGFDKNGLAAGILGNDLLKRFNVILDNQNGHIYLEPNSLVNEPYDNPEYYVVRVVAGLLILFLAVIAFFVYRKRRRKKRNK